MRYPVFCSFIHPPSYVLKRRTVNYISPDHEFSPTFPFSRTLSSTRFLLAVV